MEVGALISYLYNVQYTTAIHDRQYTVKVFICGDYEFLSKMYDCPELVVRNIWIFKCKYNVISRPYNRMLPLFILQNSN